MNDDIYKAAVHLNRTQFIAMLAAQLLAGSDKDSQGTVKTTSNVETAIDVAFILLNTAEEEVRKGR